MTSNEHNEKWERIAPRDVAAVERCDFCDRPAIKTEWDGIAHEVVNVCKTHAGGGAGTIRTTTPRVVRNELCPCGSGKKFKRCCCGPRPVASDATRSDHTSTTGASS